MSRTSLSLQRWLLQENDDSLSSGAANDFGFDYRLYLMQNKKVPTIEQFQTLRDAYVQFFQHDTPDNLHECLKSSNLRKTLESVSGNSFVCVAFLNEK